MRGMYYYSLSPLTTNATTSKPVPLVFDWECDAYIMSRLGMERVLEYYHEAQCEGGQIAVSPIVPPLVLVLLLI